MIPGWSNLENTTQLGDIVSNSDTKAILIFKHSTRCSISTMALNRLRNFSPPNTDCYYLDLLAHRNISNEIAEKFQVYHESPQVLVIRKGECVYEESHYGIRPEEIEAQIALAG